MYYFRGIKMKLFFSKSLILCGLLVIYSNVHATINQLKKVYHHTAQDSQVRKIELGSVVLYFSDKITINPTKNNQNGGQQEFFFPNVKVTNVMCKNMIASLNAYAGQNYRAYIQEVVKPSPGIKLTISFDPDKVGLSYDQFDSIGLQKGIIFRMHNKELLKKLQSRNKPLLQLACKKKRLLCCS